MKNTIQNVGILPAGRNPSPLSDIDPETRLDKKDFEKLLVKIDQGLRALPATAQVRILHKKLLTPSCNFSASIELTANFHRFQTYPSAQSSTHSLRCCANLDGTSLCLQTTDLLSNSFELPVLDSATGNSRAQLTSMTQSFNHNLF